MAYETPTHYYGSEQQWLATLSFTNLPLNIKLNTITTSTTIRFDKFAGGDTSATTNKHRAGGMGNEVTYVSLPTYSDVTLTKAYNTQADHNIVGDIHKLVGKAMVTVNLQPLDDTGTPWGTSRSYYGRIASVKDGGTDSNSNATRMWEIDISVESLSDVASTAKLSTNEFA